jgi:ParB family chromosome partitioning protein
METNNITNNETNNVSESGIPRRRALGRGLEELFNSEILDYNAVEEKIVNETPKEAITQIKLSELRSNPYQPRKVFNEEALEELANSIKEHGVFQPIIVKKSIKGYEIIAGERRVKASLMAGLTEIPAIIRDFNDTQMMEIALLENLQRENLTAIEEASAYKKLQETLSLTQEELAKRLGKSRSHITNMLGLLSLPNNIQEEINDKKITMGHARVLSKLENASQQEELAEKVISEGISVRELEELTKEPTIIKSNPQKHKQQTENKYSYLQSEISEKLGTKVIIKKNKIEINFVNESDLNRLLEYMHIEVGK